MKIFFYGHTKTPKTYASWDCVGNGTVEAAYNASIVNKPHFRNVFENVLEVRVALL